MLIFRILIFKYTILFCLHKQLQVYVFFNILQHDVDVLELCEQS